MSLFYRLSRVLLLSEQFANFAVEECVVHALVDVLHGKVVVGVASGFVEAGERSEFASGWVLEALLRQLLCRVRAFVQYLFWWSVILYVVVYVRQELLVGGSPRGPVLQHSLHVLVGQTRE